MAGIAVLGALLVLLAISSVAGAGSNPTPVPSPSLEEATVERAPASNFPDPVIQPLPQTIQFEGTSLSLAPLALDSLNVLSLPIDGLTAVKIAEGEFGPSAFPTKVTASPALDGEGTAVWAVLFDGICVPIYGPFRESSEPSGCASDRLTVIVDGKTGQVYGAITPG
jgi:hypothetical protein